MNPQGILISNQFISPDPNLGMGLSTGPYQSRSKNREYNELQKFMRTELMGHEDPLLEEQRDFISDEEDDYDLLEKASSTNNPALANILNRPQWLVNEDPLALSHGVRPILGKTVQDLTRFRYRKQIVSYINIDSRWRDTRKYPKPSDYTLYLNKEYHNLLSMRLTSVSFREPPPPINERNGSLVWTTSYAGLNNVIPQEIEYCAQLPPGFYTLGELTQTIERTLNAVPHEVAIEYFGTSVTNPFPSFYIDIDPFTRKISFIQRLESLQIIQIETTAVGSNSIIISIPTSTGAPGACDAGYPFQPTAETVPIILTELSLFVNDVGGIPVELLELVPFTPTVAGVCPVSGPPVYRCVGPGVVGGIDVYQYELCVYQSNGMPANATSIIQVPLIGSTLPNFPGGHPVEATVGRALEWSMVTNCGFGKFIGILDGNDIAPSPSPTQLIHTNLNSQGQVVNIVPWMIIGAGMLSLDTRDYIFMRLGTTSKPLGTISGNLVCAKGSAGGTVPGVQKEEGVYFAKILFSATPPGDVTIRFAGADRIFYDAPLVQLYNLTVELFDAEGQPLNANIDHSFTLQMVEAREVLKETLIDSRTGIVSDTGSGLVTTNPV